MEVQDRLCRLENLIENLAAASISDSASQKANPSEGQVEQLDSFLEHSRANQVQSDQRTSSFVFSSSPDAPPHETDYYPSIKQSEKLVNLFFQNVEPFMMILHQGSFKKELEQYRRQAHPYQRDFEALLLSVHALAIATIPSMTVHALFGNTKETLLESHGSQAEKALAQCELLKSRSIICFQALLCHITFLLEQVRYDEGSAMIGLAVRLAQRLGLNHDPNHFNFSSFSADQRRRLWLYLQHLDFRCCDNIAAEPLCAGMNVDCKRPKNVNDNQWEPCPYSKKSTEPESVLAFREMTFVTLRHEVESVQSEILRQMRSDVSDSAQGRVMQYRALVQQRILQYFDETDPLQRLVAAYIRSRIDHIDIIARHNHFRSCLEDERVRKSLFVFAVELLESISRIESDLLGVTEISPTCSWLWILRSSVPWHAIAVTLTNLTMYFQGPLVSRAWSQIDAIFDRFSKNDCNLVAMPVWKPLNQLRDQAQFKRNSWLEQELGTEGLASTSDNGTGDPFSPTALPMARTPLEVCVPLELKGSPVDFANYFEANNAPLDVLMPDMQSDAQNDFFDFFALSSDQFNN
ncbi:MAG: hypothetical protein Q9160_007823 [Pyrenula sp. 1 TL-2023]